MSSFSRELFYVVVVRSDIPYQSAFSVGCFVFLCLCPTFLCELTPKWRHILFLRVRMFSHLIDVNRRARQCSQSRSRLLSGNVTIPANVHQSDETQLELRDASVGVFGISAQHTNFWGSLLTVHPFDVNLCL